MYFKQVHLRKVQNCTFCRKISDMDSGLYYLKKKNRKFV